MQVESESLFAAICDSPTDRTAQLVYADFLAERSRPEEHAWRWIAAFKRRPVTFRAWRLDRDPYWACSPCSPLREDEICAGNGWINWGKEQYDFSGDSPTWSWPWSAGMSTIPRGLFRYLPRSNNGFDDGYTGHRPYNSVGEAFTALVSAYALATRPRKNRLERIWYGPQWVPDWSLVDSVPNE
jgi:uncharacterized protein (TIGR02996 family)